MQDYKVKVTAQRTVIAPVKATSAEEAIERVREAWDGGCEYGEAQMPGEPSFAIVDDDDLPEEIKLLERLIEALQAEPLTPRLASPNQSMAETMIKLPGIHGEGDLT